MSADRLKLNKRTPDDPMFQRMLEVHAAMLTAAAFDRMQDDLDPVDHTQITITAAAFVAGYLSGASVIAGNLFDRDRKRVETALIVTFRQAWKVGKDNALIAAASSPEAGNA